MPDAPRMAARRLYRGIDGFLIPKLEERCVRQSRGSPLYGEITPMSVQRLLARLDLTPRDAFYDLGSGIGKVVVQAAMTVPLKKCVGIELARSRVLIARSVLRKARKQGLIKARRCSFRNEDFLDSELGDATVVYSCSTAFSLGFMRMVMRKLEGIGRELTFVTLQEPEPRRRFDRLETLRLDTTWARRTEVHVYRVAPPRRR
jgi:hypothetical protein